MSDVVINPLTRREVRVGSVIYNKLVKKGVIQPFQQAPQVPQRSRAYSALQSSLPVINQVSKPRAGQFVPKTRAPPVRVPVRPPPKQPVYEDQFTEYEEYDNYADYDVKPKKDPRVKINSVLNSSVKALKQLENEELPEDEEEIKNKLIELLKQQNNKYINKFLV